MFRMSKTDPKRENEIKGGNVFKDSEPGIILYHCTSCTSFSALRVPLNRRNGISAALHRERERNSGGEMRQDGERDDGGYTLL